MTESKRTARTFRWTSSINVSLGFSTGVATGVMTGVATGGRTPENWAASREKGPDPNADQISSAHPWDKPARSPFSSACGANTERAEEGDTEVAGRGLRSDGIFSFSVLASGKVFGMCFRSVAPSGKLHLQKPSVPPSSVPSVFRAASRFSKESSLTDRHSGQPPPAPLHPALHSAQSFHNPAAQPSWISGVFLFLVVFAFPAMSWCPLKATVPGA